MRKAVVLLVVVAVVAVASARGITSSASSAAIRAPQDVYARSAIYSTGFDSSEGYAIGQIAGQNGWTTFTGRTEGHVDNANPAAGDQHLRIAYDATQSQGAYTGAFSPNLGTLDPGHYTLSVDVNITAAGGADYDLIPQAPSQGFLSARVKFNYQGDILVLDDLGSGLGFVDTGVAWNAGQYTNLTIDLDADANTINYYYGGNLIYSSVAGVFAGTTVEQVVLISDNYQADDVGDFDNLSITPEPAGLALLALGVLLRRR